MDGVSSCPFPAPADSERSAGFRLGFSDPEGVPLVLNLKTNSSKSNSINFCLRHRQEQEYRPATMMDDVLLEEAESVKFLGMHSTLIED
ncbi:hypothetical protein J6590_102660 [Homalodisca vitripennis]|nr:hypothetical protein J6590_102660 [Homalodisca vitripennis]